MRIEGFSSSYLPERVSRAQTAVVPFRDVQQQAQQRAQQPVDARADASTNAATQDIGLVPAPTKAPAVSALVSQQASPRSNESMYQGAMPNYAAQALASYASTASFVTEGDAYEVMGLDLYA